MPSPKQAIDKFIKRLEAAIDEAIKPRSLDPVARFAIDTIVKRTRLGYGVNKAFGMKTKLKKLSPNYVEFRKKYRGLSSLARPGNSNLTLTGQLLDSMNVIKSKNGSVTIGPTGSRFDTSKSNLQIAAEQEEAGRIFNRVSQLEFQQILRFYRRTFGDLLKKKKLLS